MLKKLLVVLAALSASSPFAQTHSLPRTDVSRGVTLPSASAALTQDAASVSINPASLSLVGPLQAYYVNEKSVLGPSNNALFLGLTPFKGLGLGWSNEWLKDVQGTSYRKSAFGFSIGDKGLALGASFNSFSSQALGNLNGLSSVDLGLSSRPFRFASLGFVVRNIDNPTRGDAALPIQYDLGLAIRPLGEKLSLAADYILDKNRSLLQGRFTYTLQAKVLRGVTLLSGLSHGLARGDATLFQVGLTVDTGHLGASYASGFSPQGQNQSVALRASLEKYESVLPQGKVVALFDFNKLLASNTSLFGGKQVDPYLRLTRLMQEAAEDPKLHGIVMKANGLNIGLAKALEISKGIELLQSRGKMVFVVLLSATDGEYLAFSHANWIAAVPGAILELDGLAASTTFLGEAMNKLGIQWEVARVGAYKNAPDQLTRSQMSREQQESINAYLDTNFGEYVRRVARARFLREEKFRASLNEGLKSPTRARELGLIDEVINPQDLDEKLKQWIPHARFVSDYQPRDTRDERWGQRPQIAVIPVLGTIAGGQSSDGTFGTSETAGAETVVKALKAAEQDDDVAAIVLRIDSGGGDTLASDLIYRAVLAAKKKKPVIASMGDVAASGGYYVAMGADAIYAEPTTLTGSIGVFFVKPAVSQLASKVGIKNEVIRRGDLAGMMGVFEPWTPAERTAAQKWVDGFYDTFITEVAACRKLSKEQVDQIAQGRVWSGEDAKQRKLVDELGGLQEALAKAKSQAGLTPHEEIDIVIVSPSNNFLRGLRSAVAQTIASEEPPLLKWARELGLDPNLAPQPGLRAQMEFSLSVR